MTKIVVAPEPWSLLVDGRPLDLPADPGSSLSSRLAVLDHSLVSELETRDLHVVSPNEKAATLLQGAAHLIQVPPTLESVVCQCTQEIIILRATDDSFDVSHSEPRWPTRIFISVPEHSPVGELRVAEAVVHESMHLNLTFLELRTELTQGTALLYSPWKSQERPASGILHGVYVFACILRFFGHLSRGDSLTESARRHIEQRREEIRTEIRRINCQDLFSCLTSNGEELARSILSCVD
jgi:HEXXH motif-containing protein